MDGFNSYFGYLVANEMTQRLDRSGSKHNVVMSLIADAAAIEKRNDIEKRQREKIVGGPTRAQSWPSYIREVDEHLEAYQQRTIDIAAGDPIESVLGIPVTVALTEKHLARAVMIIFPAALPERNRDRDFEILRLLAAGKMSERSIAKKLGVPQSTVPTVKKYKTGAIWRTVMEQTWFCPVADDAYPPEFWRFNGREIPVL